MTKHLIFGFIGGDLRQFYMVKELVMMGHKVLTYGLEMPEVVEEATKIGLLEEIILKADVIILPIPFSRDGIHILTNDNNINIEINEFLKYLTPQHKVFGGDIYKYCKNAFDFMKEDSIASWNAIATGEGTIAEAIRYSTINLHHSECIVLGYGKCAKVLARKLKGLDANVTIAARDRNVLVEAESLGYKTVWLEDIDNTLKKSQFIFNTIPALILDSSRVELIDEEAVIIDIASKPGGTDFDACEKRGITAKLSLGLPGKYAPKTSAKILTEAVFEQLK